MRYKTITFQWSREGRNGTEHRDEALRTVLEEQRQGAFALQSITPITSGSPGCPDQVDLLIIMEEE
jgi:hypothetical protein